MQGYRKIRLSEDIDMYVSKKQPSFTIFLLHQFSDNITQHQFINKETTLITKYQPCLNTCVKEKDTTIASTTATFSNYYY